MPLRRADPAVAGRVGGPARGLRRARHRLAPRARWCARSTRPPGRPARRRRPSCPTTCSSACPVHRVPAVVVESGLSRRRLDPGRPAHAGDPLPGRLRRRRRHQRRHAEGRRVRRGPGRRRGRAHHRPRPRERVRRRRTTAAASATWSSAHDQVAKVDVTFLQRAGARPAPSTGRRRRWPPTRPSSGPAASAAGSAATGRRSVQIPGRGRVVDVSWTSRHRPIWTDLGRQPASYDVDRVRQGPCRPTPCQLRRTSRRQVHG